jgi:3-oxoacyl-[acyl-carrier-protein] synthase-1
MGFHMVRHGYQDCIICGGSQEVNLFCVGSFDALGAFSKQESNPASASKPFDRRRDGLVPSGGAATVILESLDHAIKRGAPIIAEVIGYGFSSDGKHISVPDVDGPIRAISMALKDAQVEPGSIDYINAHATSTPIGDQNEAKAIDHVFGKVKPLISSTKSMTGHEMWMAGASEVIYSILMMENSFVAPNINFEEPDEFSSKLNIASKTTKKEINSFLSNSFGFGGTNSTLIIKKFN